MRDIIITGVPRGGTTLAAAILDQAPDCFCLSEPEDHIELMLCSSSKNDFVDRLEASFSSIRATLIAGGKVIDRREQDGSPVTNYFGKKLLAEKRQVAFTVQPIRRVGLSPNFRLGIKHNALYSAVLPEIAHREKFKIIVIVRHPVDVIASWASLELPASHGRLPAADRYWPEMQQLSNSDMPLLDKQLLMYELMCSRFLGLGDRAVIIHYEDMVNRPELLLEAAGMSNEGIADRIHIKIQEPSRHPELEERRKILLRAGRLPNMERLYPF